VTREEETQNYIIVFMSSRCKNILSPFQIISHFDLGRSLTPAMSMIIQGYQREKNTKIPRNAGDAVHGCKHVIIMVRKASPRRPGARRAQGIPYTLPGHVWRPP